MQEKTDQEIEQLIQYSIGFADEALHQYGEFYPFAAMIDTAGTLTPIAVHAGDEYPDSNDLIKEFKEILEGKRDRAELVAYAITIDSRITNKEYPQSTDAIAMLTFHTQREKQISYYFPYRHLEEGIQIMEGWGEYA